MLHRMSGAARTTGDDGGHEDHGPRADYLAAPEPCAAHPAHRPMLPSDPRPETHKRGSRLRMLDPH